LSQVAVTNGPWAEYQLRSRNEIFPSLLKNPDGPTILVGHEPRLNVFVGFNIDMLAKGRAGEAVVTQALLERAAERGIAIGMRIGGQFVHPMETAGRDGTRDTIVAFTPDQMLHYALSADEWFECAQEPKTFSAMFLATDSTFWKEDNVDGLSRKRARVVRTFYYYARSSNFARRVLTAYKHSCAITGLQLDLPVAAHILPVGSGVDNDSVSNGIALSPTLHEAFDDGLIYFRYMNDGRLFVRSGPLYDAIKSRELTQKEELVMAFVNKEIPKEHLPEDKKDWPDEDMIAAGMKHRAVYPGS
jgi:hypothetical protein